ncbi:DUF448 domain-containing protein [Erythrobacter sp. Alg231-14]|uniref:DUF448 domain-containing protein n=1 Tax=Erythrobacter sp. Alg231-14 TaxID=1922225 RepID=UPI000D55956E
MRTPPNESLTSDIAEAPASQSSAQEIGSERRCVLSGEVHPRAELIRLAVSPSGEVLPDPNAKAPGRGAWIAPDRAALESAVSDGLLKRALMRAFKGGPEGETLSYSDDLPQAVEAALTRTLLDRLGLEMRGGNIVLGSSRIEEQARTGRISLLLHASDSSEDGRKKLDQAWRVGSDAEGSGMRGSVLPLDRGALSVALGRENVVHLGVSSQNDGAKNTTRASDRVGQAIGRLSRYKGMAGFVVGNDPPG